MAFSFGGRWHGSQVSKARPGAPFDGYRHGELGRGSPCTPDEFSAPNDKRELGGSSGRPLKPKQGLNGPPKTLVAGVASFFSPLSTRLRESAAWDDKGEGGVFISGIGGTDPRSQKPDFGHLSRAKRSIPMLAAYCRHWKYICIHLLCTGKSVAVNQPIGRFWREAIVRCAASSMRSPEMR